MDQKRMLFAIGVSIAILLIFQLAMPHHAATPPHPVVATRTTPASESPPATGNPAGPGTQPMPAAVPANVPRVKIEAARVEGSMSLLGARLDDLVLRDYRETVNPASPLVRLLEPRSDPQPYYVQFGWSAADAKIKLPDSATMWTASPGQLTTDHPVTLSWDNGAGLTFQLVLAVDDNYMFTVDQHVRNATGAAVALFPWARIRRDYTPQVLGYYLLHEGPVGVVSDRLQELTYAKMRTAGEKANGVAYSGEDDGGWAGITDKYWLTALIPDQKSPVSVAYRYLTENGAPRYQVDFVDRNPETIPAGGEASTTSRLFAGAKEVHLLDHYQADLHIPYFYKAVDFGWFEFLTRPIFFALDWLNNLLGNFGLAIMAFTLFVKLLFFPLANKSYRSMSKMKLLGPKVTALRERFKDDPGQMQQEMMKLYRSEKVNPAGGCLPMVIQIPVFFCLYKDIFVTIEMRQAPFFGWIHDLSVPDPTNVFNLFGLLPFDPTHIAPLLHVGIWPLIMGCTMFLQQKLNPPPPDPTQARIFQFMPVVFTFMLARFPAGLVIYWSWNNTLTIVQQWLIMRSTRLRTTRVART